MKLKYLSPALALACALTLAGCGEDRPGGGAGTPAPPGAAAARPPAPLPDNGFRATLTVANPPTKLAPGEPATLTVKVRNSSDVAWPLGGRPGDGFFQVNLGDHWLGADGKEVKVDERIAMPHAVGPGEEVERQLVIKAPDKPGDYVLELDVVQEGVAWFSQKGSQPLKLNVKVAR
jgi:hypothetical protein